MGIPHITTQLFRAEVLVHFPPCPGDDGSAESPSECSCYGPKNGCSHPQSCDMIKAQWSDLAAGLLKHEYHVETLGGKNHSYPFISIHSLYFIVFHCISLLRVSKLSKLWQSVLKTGQHTGSNLPNQAFAPQPAPLWIHWALRCPHGCLQEETNSCHWCVQLLQCLLGVPDWQRSLSNDKPGAAARGDGTLG